MTARTTVAVLGGGGFVGGAVMRALASRDGIVTEVVQAPRLNSVGRDVRGLLGEAGTYADTAMDALFTAFAGADVVVNAAGIADASATSLQRLTGANALMPAVALLAAEKAGVRRLVHVSSAAVQGRAEVLDESDQRDAFSPYALSKCLGEEVLLSTLVSTEVVVYRPPGVHSPDRGVTRRIASIARSPLSSVAGDGTRPTPQALIHNVADALSYLCIAASAPRVVIHPWEGLTVASLMELLGRGRRPRRIPEPVARLAVRSARAAVSRVPSREADVRRIEMLWFGQRQAESWLIRQGWSPPVGLDGWRRLAAEVARRTAPRASGAPRE